MTVKAEDVYNGLEVIREIYDKQLPVWMGLEFLRLLENLEREAKFIETQRRKIIENYGYNKDNKGDNVKLKKEDIELVNSALEELKNQEVNIECTKVKIDDIEKLNVDFSIKQLLYLKKFL